MPIVRLKDVRTMSSEERRKKVTELQTELVRRQVVLSKTLHA